MLGALTDKGLRALAGAGKATGGSVPTSAADAESGLSLLGLVAMEDPPRPDVAEAIASCRRARINVAMITGDHPATAAVIATQVGLRRPDDPVLSGEDVPADEQVLGAVFDRGGLVVA